MGTLAFEAALNVLPKVLDAMVCKELQLWDKYESTLIGEVFLWVRGKLEKAVKDASERYRHGDSGGWQTINTTGIVRSKSDTI